MIKATELKSTGKPGYRLRRENASQIDLGFIKSIIQNTNEEEYGLPIEISEDQIKSGSLFNSSIEEYLILTNVNHRDDYFKYCLTLRKQGKMATVNLQYYGSSVLTAKAQQTEERKNSLGGMLLNVVSGVNQAAYDAEYEYYEMLENLFQDAFQ